jgi:hypothetical protein
MFFASENALCYGHTFNLDIFRHSTNIVSRPELSRHDDVESLAYVLIYFAFGATLPWHDIALFFAAYHEKHDDEDEECAAAVLADTQGELGTRFSLL